MKYLSLYLLLSLALIGQVNGMTNKQTPKQAPKVELPATNGMNDIDNNDDDDFVVESEFMTDTQTNDGNGSAMQLEAGEQPDIQACIAQCKMAKKHTNGAYGMPEATPATEMPDMLTGAYANTQDIQNAQDTTTGAE
jgi:hypothetical protein